MVTGIVPIAVGRLILHVPSGEAEESSGSTTGIVDSRAPAHAQTGQMPFPLIVSGQRLEQDPSRLTAEIRSGHFLVLGTM